VKENHCRVDKLLDDDMIKINVKTLNYFQYSPTAAGKLAYVSEIPPNTQ
jgi:hypothetical protein